MAEGASTRLLVHAAKLVNSGIEPAAACQSAISLSLTDDREMLEALSELLESII